MLKINTSFKIILLIITISFISSCGEDDNNNSNTTEPTVKYERIEASSYKLTGNIKKLLHTSKGIEILDWDLGEQVILVEVDGELFSDISGFGLVDTTGKFVIALDGDLSTQFMYNPSSKINALDQNPDNLLVSNSPARFFIGEGVNRKEIFCRSVKSTLDSVDVKYYWNFYSTEGKLQRNVSDDFDDLLGTYDIRCRKGWNLIEHKISPSEFKSIDVLPDDVIFYIYD